MIQAVVIQTSLERSVSALGGQTCVRGSHVKNEDSEGDNDDENFIL